MLLNQLTATKLKPMLSAGVISSVDVMRAILQRVEDVEQSVGAFISLRDTRELLKDAEAVDEKRHRGEAVGLLAGLPVAVKDNICTEQLATTCGSRMLSGYRPPYDAHVIELVRAADGIILGKTNMDEFSMGSSTEHSAFKITRNPRNLEYVPGGTSGGSAAAVAADETILAIGSDTGGSIRQPASYCGVFGLKPTYGAVSRRGLVAYASSFDQIGSLSKSASDARLLFEVISGHDPGDATSARNRESTMSGASRPGKRLRIGVPREYFVEGIQQEVRECAERLAHSAERQGHSIVEISLPHTKFAVPTYYVLTAAEMSANLSRYDGCRFGHRSSKASTIGEMMRMSRTEGFGEEVKRRVMLGTFVLSSGHYEGYYQKAQKVRTLIAKDFMNAFEVCDVIMAPVSPGPAFRIGEKISDPLAMYLVDIFSVTANLAGLPAISVPSGLSKEGLPLSMQFIAPHFTEQMLLELAEDLSESGEESERG